MSKLSLSKLCFFNEGLRQPIFDLTNDKQKTTADLRFRLPDGVHAQSSTECHETFDTKVTNGVSRYQHFLDIKVTREHKYFNIQLCQNKTNSM